MVATVNSSSSSSSRLTSSCHSYNSLTFLLFLAFILFLKHFFHGFWLAIDRQRLYKCKRVVYKSTTIPTYTLQDQNIQLFEHVNNGEEQIQFTSKQTPFKRIIDTKNG